MDELIKRLKKSLSDFTAKLTDNEGFFQQGKPTLQPIQEAISNWASQPQNYQVANNLTNFADKTQNFITNYPKNYLTKTLPSAVNTLFSYGKQFGEGVGGSIIAPIETKRIQSITDTNNRIIDANLKTARKLIQMGKIDEANKLFERNKQLLEQSNAEINKNLSFLEKGKRNLISGGTKTTMAAIGGNYALSNPLQTFIGSNLYGAIGAAGGKDFFKEAGKGIAEQMRIGSVVQFTNPIIAGLIGKSKEAVSNPLFNQLMVRAIGGLGNVTENEFLAKLDQREPTSIDRLQSFALGALLFSQGKKEDWDTLKDNVKNTLIEGGKKLNLDVRPHGDVWVINKDQADYKYRNWPEYIYQAYRKLKSGDYQMGLSIKPTKDENLKMVSEAVKQGHITPEEGQAILEDLAKQGGKIKIKGKTTPPPTNLPVGESGGEVGKIKIKGSVKPQTDEFLKGLEEDMKKLQSEPPQNPPPPEILNLGQGGAGDKANINTALNFDRFKQRLIQALNNINASKTEGIKTGLQFKDLPKDVSPIDVIKFIENPENAPKKLEPYIKEVRQVYDQLYNLAKKEGIDMKYVKNYLTHIWDRPQDEVAQLYKQYKTKFKFSNERTLPTYEEGIKMGLKPKYSNPAQIIADYTSRLKQTIEKVNLLRDLEKEGFLVAKRMPGFEPVTVSGIEPKAKIIGENKIREGVYYAPPEVAAVLRRAFGEQGSRPFSLLAKIMSLWQDIKLAGGIPGTPLNAWTFGQVIKEITAGRPIHALKAVVNSMTQEGANKFFQEHIDDILAMEKRGIGVSTSLNLENLTGVKNIGEIFKEKGLGGVWHAVVNDPTFKRFSPMLQIDFFSRMRKELINKGYDKELAADIAAKATKNFYGIIDFGEMALRDKNIEDLITTVFFAPKYRESVLNFLLNNIKALKNPLSPENIYNTRYIIGTVLTYLAYDKLNRMFNGRGLAENPPGTEDKLLIPVSKITGNENDKTVIGVPIGPSVLTLPRAGARAVLRVAKGDIKGAIGDVVSTASSIGLKTIGDIAMNSDYFGKPIYDEGDDLPTATKKIAQYFFTQTQHPYIAEIFDPRNQKDPAYQRLARAMELPLRFYTEKSLNAKYFFQFQNEVLRGLDAKEKAAYNSIPKIDEKDPQDPNRRILKYQIYLTYPNVFKAKQAIEIAMAQKLNKEIDPLYLVDYQTAKKYMRYETLPEGSPERKAMNNVYPELKVLFEKRAEYFKRNPMEDVGQKLAMTQPQPSESVKKKMDEKNWSDPEVKDYLNALREWQNTQRIKLGLPSLDQYGNIEGTKGFSFGGKAKKIKISLKPPKTKKISIRPKAVRMPKIKISPKMAKISLKKIKTKSKKPKIKVLTS